MSFQGLGDLTFYIFTEMEEFNDTLLCGQNLIKIYHLPHCSSQSSQSEKDNVMYKAIHLINGKTSNLSLVFYKLPSKKTRLDQSPQGV